MNAEEYATKHWLRKRVWRNLKGPRHQDRFAEIASHLEGETFLDVGCACGHSTDILAGMRPGVDPVRWTGIDFSHSMIDAARETFPQYQYYCLADSKSLRLEVHPRDSVVCSEVIEHVEDDAGLVAALWAVTGKVLVITTPNKKVNDPGHLRVYTAIMLRNLIAPHADRDGATFEIYSKGDFFYVVCRKQPAPQRAKIAIDGQGALKITSE